MSFVLSIIHLPKGEAKYGKAEIFGPAAEREGLFKDTYWALRKRDVVIHPEVANKFAEQVMRTDIGVEVVEPGTGLTFRTDKTEGAPHPCPCDGCGRLVLPDDHAFAHAEDAYCLGCFTWEVDAPGCLPRNSAHITGDQA